jgi:hypothetical protein
MSIHVLGPCVRGLCSHRERGRTTLGPALRSIWPSSRSRRWLLQITFLIVYARASVCFEIAATSSLIALLSISSSGFISKCSHAPLHRTQIVSFWPEDQGGIRISDLIRGICMHGIGAAMADQRSILGLGRGFRLPKKITIDKYLPR